MFLLIVGDVNANRLRPDIERITADLKLAPFFMPQRPVEPPQTEVKTALVRDANARETWLSLGFHIPSIRSVDVNALDLAADILGARESSRLVGLLEKEKQIVHSINTSSITPKDPGLFIVYATADAQKTDEAVKGVLDEIKRLATEPPSLEELNRAKVNIEATYRYEMETVGGMARNIGSFEADMGYAEYLQNYLRWNMAVTPEQVSEVAGRYLTAPNLTVTVLMPQKDRPNYTVAALNESLKSYVPAKGAVVGPGAAGQAVVRSLPNGIRVVLLPDHSNAVASVRFACLGGTRFESKESAGVMNFIARSITTGAAGMDERAIARKIEDMGGRIEGFSGYDSIGLNVSFFSRNIEEGLKLAAQIYADPSFPEDKIERERKLILNKIKTAPDRPTFYAVQILNETLYEKHPYGHDKKGTNETVKAFTRDDLVKAYKRFATPSNTVISAVGDLDPEKTFALIAELFGKIPAKALDAPAVPQEAPLTSVRNKTVRQARAKAHIVIGFLGTTLKDEDRYPLTVLNNVLAGQGGRLFVELRDKKSLAYAVTSFLRPGMDPGSVALYIACDQAKVEEAANSLFNEVRRVRDAPVTEEELNRSKKNLIGSHRISLQSSASRALNAALNTVYGLGPDYDPVYIEKISKVTTAQVQAAAKKYMDTERCALVKILPEEGKTGQEPAEEAKEE
jgi:zinc protease